VVVEMAVRMVTCCSRFANGASTPRNGAAREEGGEREAVEIAVRHRASGQ